MAADDLTILRLKIRIEVLEEWLFEVLKTNLWCGDEDEAEDRKSIDSEVEKRLREHLELNRKEI